MRFQEVINKLKSNRSMDDGGVQINLIPFRDLEVAATEKKFNEFIDALSSCSNLTSFIVQGHDLFSESMARSQHALLDDVASTKGGRFEQIAEALQNKSLLQEMVVNHVTVTLKALKELVKCFPVLNVVDISGVQLGNRKAFPVLYDGLGLSVNLHALRYTDHALSEDNFTKLIKLYKSRDGLVDVDLRCRELTEEQCRELSLARLEKRIARAKALSKEYVYLDLADLDIDEVGICRLIKEINIAKERVGVDRRDAFIKSLNLSRNIFGDSGLQTLLLALSNNHTIQTLDLRGMTHFSSVSLDFLLEVYRSSTSLLQIYMDESLLMDDAEIRTIFGDKFATVQSGKSTMSTVAHVDRILGSKDDSSIVCSPQPAGRRGGIGHKVTRSVSCFSFGGRRRPSDEVNMVNTGHRDSLSRVGSTLETLLEEQSHIPGCSSGLCSPK